MCVIQCLKVYVGCISIYNRETKAKITGKGSVSFRVYVYISLVLVTYLEVNNVTFDPLLQV